MIFDNLNYKELNKAISPNGNRKLELLITFNRIIQNDYDVNKF